MVDVGAIRARRLIDVVEDLGRILSGLKRIVLGCSALREQLPPVYHLLAISMAINILEWATVTRVPPSSSLTSIIVRTNLNILALKAFVAQALAVYPAPRLALLDHTPALTIGEEVVISTSSRLLQQVLHPLAQLEVFELPRLQQGMQHVLQVH